MRARGWIAVSAAIVAGLSSLLLSEGPITLTGRVVDADGQAMHGVFIKAKKRGGMTKVVLSQMDGSFTVTGLPSGAYEVVADRMGYQPATHRVAAGSSQLSFTLRAGPVDRLNLSTADLATVLPDSPYKQQLLGCEFCHSWTGLAARKTYALDDWIAGMHLMNEKGYSRIRDEDIEGTARYLQDNFGPHATLRPVLPPDPVDRKSLNIEYLVFDIPTPDAMPHTAQPDGKGNVWFSEFGGDKIGYVNVATGRMEEFATPPHDLTRVHGVAVDAQGFVWFTEQGAGAIARFDPRSKTWEEFMVPAPRTGLAARGNVRQDEPGDGRRPARPAAAPHTLIADRQSNIWFTAGSHPLRKLNVETGEFTEYVIREGGGGLYGVTMDQKGRIWYAGLGINEVGYVDPPTGQVTKFQMLSRNAGPRRLKIDSRGVAWFNLYNVSKIAKADPASGEVREWDLPTPDGDPYPFGIDAKDRLWTQTAIDDRLHMFDPMTETFTTYLMPEKGTGLRDFFLDENGWLWTAVFGRNQVMGFRVVD